MFGLELPLWRIQVITPHGWRVFVHPSQQFVMLWLSGTVIHSWVSRLHVLPLQSYCVTGAVNGKTEFTTKGIFQSYVPGTGNNPSNPFQCMSVRLSDPSCPVATNRIRDLTVDVQRLTRSDSQRLWLSKLFTVHTCREYKLLVITELLQLWINMFSYWLDVFSYSLTRASSQEQQQYSYRQHGLCWSWTGRWPVLRLTTYKVEREENDPQSLLHNPMRRHRVVEMLFDSGDRNHRSLTHFCIIG